MNSNFVYARPDEDDEVDGDRQAYDDYFNDANDHTEKGVQAMEDVYNENLGEDFEVRISISFMDSYFIHLLGDTLGTSFT